MNDTLVIFWSHLPSTRDDFILQHSITLNVFLITLCKLINVLLIKWSTINPYLTLPIPFPVPD